MWIHQEVDALVRYTRGVQYPSLQAIRWGSRRIDLAGSTRVERSTMSLRYVCSDGLTRYWIRFEPRRMKWFLESIDDSGIVQPDDNLPIP